MRLFERDGQLYVRDVCGLCVYFWPVMVGKGQFVQLHGSERLHRLLSGEGLYDDRDSFGFRTGDGLVLDVPDGGKTRPAWIELLSAR